MLNRRSFIQSLLALPAIAALMPNATQACETPQAVPANSMVGIKGLPYLVDNSGSFQGISRVVYEPPRRGHYGGVVYVSAQDKVFVLDEDELLILDKAK